MKNEEMKDIETAPKPEGRKFCSCGDLRTFFIALLTSLIVVAGYHMARQTVRCLIRCSRAQQIRQSGGACRCRMRKFHPGPEFAPGCPGDPRFERPRFHGKPGMKKPGFPGKRGRFGKRPVPPCEEVKPEQAPQAPAVKPAAKPVVVKPEATKPAAETKK